MRPEVLRKELFKIKKRDEKKYVSLITEISQLDYPDDLGGVLVPRDTSDSHQLRSLYHNFSMDFAQPIDLTFVKVSLSEGKVPLTLPKENMNQLLNILNIHGQVYFFHIYDIATDFLKIISENEEFVGLKQLSEEISVSQKQFIEDEQITEIINEDKIIGSPEEIIIWICSFCIAKYLLEAKIR